MSDGDMFRGVLTVLRRYGWSEFDRMDGRRWVEHRCGSISPVRWPAGGLYSDDSAFAAISKAVDAVGCYCVPGPPEGWVPPDPDDDDLPATRGEIKALAKAVERLGDLFDAWRNRR